MSTLDAVAHHRQTVARDRANAMKSDAIISKYLDGMSRRGELLPGAAPIIIDKIFGRVGGRPGTQSGTALEMFSRGVAYLDGEGAKYLNVTKAEPVPPMKAMLQRLGVPVPVVEHLYTTHAAPLAGRTGTALAGDLGRILADHEEGRYIGVTPLPAREPVVHPAPAHGETPTAFGKPMSEYLAGLGR